MEEEKEEYLKMYSKKYVLSMKPEEAMDFMLKSAQYHEFELPAYFDFDEVLSFVREKIGDAKYKDCCSGSPSDKKVNFDVLMSKDGKYGVRPLMLTNPYLYYFLVREICEEKHWKSLQEHFKECDLSEHGIYSLAMPIAPAKNEVFFKSTTILNWWQTMEQRSLELSLEYKYMFVTDITNCYGSINPQSIEWALNRRNTEKEINKNTAFASSLIMYLKDMQQGRNVGIPQGGTIFNIIGEMILSYCDLLLYKRLRAEDINDGSYVVLRYRDDYKIYSNDIDELKRISYILQEVLDTLNFRMNTDKTSISSSIVTDTLKPDKLQCIADGPIMNGKWCAFRGFQKHLMYILIFSRKFPNSGQLKVMLSDFNKRLESYVKPRKYKKKDGSEVEYIPRIRENVKAMCGVAVQIALENVTVVHYVLRVISRFVNEMEKEDREKVIEMIKKKFDKQQNSTYIKLWLQNISHPIDKRKALKCPYNNVALCRVVFGEDVALWDNSWLKKAYTKDFPLSSVVLQNVLEELKEDYVEVSFRETLDYVSLDEVQDILDLDIEELLYQQQIRQEDIVGDIPYEAYEYHQRMMQDKQGVNANDFEYVKEAERQMYQDALGVKVKDVKRLNGEEVVVIDGDMRDMFDEETYKEIMKERRGESMVESEAKKYKKVADVYIDDSIVNIVDEATYKKMTEQKREEK